MKKLIFTISLLAAIDITAQNGGEVYQFLNLPVSPRQAALGSDAISVGGEDVSMAIVNPALLNDAMEKRLNANFALYLADTKYGTIGYSKSITNTQHLVAYARYMDYGSFIRTNESSQITGDFSALDANIGVGYAYQFEKNWTIGGNLNFITSKIDQFTSAGITGSFAISYFNKHTHQNISLVLRNFGSQIKSYNGTIEKVPFRVDLGYTKKLEGFPLALTITAHNLQKFNISSEFNNNAQEVGFARKIADHLSFGAELFPDENFNIRLGYNVKRGNELAVLDQRSFAGLSAGFGVKISSFRFEYTHARYHNSGNLNMLGISLDMVDIMGNRR